MEHVFAASRDSPLQMLRMLEDNLKRERRIFAVAIGLLIFSSMCAAFAAIVFLVNSTLRTELADVQSVMRGVNIGIFSRYNMLKTGELLLEVTPQDYHPSPNGPRAALPCAPLPSDSEDASMSRICSAALRAIPDGSLPFSLQFARFDGSASYGFEFFTKRDADEGPGTERLRSLVDTAKATMSSRGLDPVSVAREHSVLWFRAPALLGFESSTIVMFMVVEKNDRPVAFVFTKVDVERVLKLVRPAALNSEITIFSDDGTVLAGDASGDARFVDKHLEKGPPGVSHWIMGHGWGARMEPLALGVGHIVVSLPTATNLAVKRTEVSVIVLVEAALSTMLVALYRYWNYRFLTRTYEQACRAVEGEILNHLQVQVTPVGLCIALRSDFSAIAANQVARNLLDLDASAMHLPAALCVAFHQHGMTLPAKGDAAVIWQFECTLEKADQSSRHLKISYTSAVVNKTDVLFCAIADITEHHEAERLLREAKETSDAAAKAKLNFFASMSHEIRTPLSSLVGNLELVARGPLAAEQEARVGAMQASAGALLQVVNDVLDFSKMDVGEMRLSEEPASIRDIVMRVMVGHSPIANRQGLRLFVVIDRECPSRLWLDPIRVAQILNNLLGNALKFTYSGKVVVRARWVDGALALSVADSGIGIPEAQRQMLFQPFVQGDAHRLTQARGTGLGLSICEHLCRLMKGRIALESTEGVGTRITVTLPLQVAESSPDEVDALLVGRPAILYRANEHREWFDALFDAERSSITYITNEGAAANVEGCDYLIATDEISDDEIDARWTDRARVIRVTQDGPLVPVARENGEIAVSIFAAKEFREAVQIVRDGRHHAISASPIRSAPLQPASANPGATVLIAEDNRLNRGLLRDQLLTLGASVIEAADGEEALDLLRKNRVDLVLTDMDMPKMNGAQLLAAARALDPSMRVYAVSASASATDVQRGRDAGFTDYLTKPVALSVLADVLRTLAVDEGNASADDASPPRLPTVPAPYVAAFVQQIGEDIAALDAICSQRDAPALRRWAHKLSGGLSVLGPSMLFDQCEELRATLREAGNWVEDVETYVSLIRSDLLELRDLHRDTIHG